MPPHRHTLLWPWVYYLHLLIKKLKHMETKWLDLGHTKNYRGIIWLWALSHLDRGKMHNAPSSPLSRAILCTDKTKNMLSFTSKQPRHTRKWSKVSPFLKSLEDQFLPAFSPSSAGLAFPPVLDRVQREHDHTALLSFPIVLGSSQNRNLSIVFSLLTDKT